MSNSGPVVHGHPYLPPRPSPAPRTASGRRRKRGSRLLLVIGILSITAGLALIAGPLWGVWQRGAADQSALGAWQNGGSDSVKGAGPSGPQLAQLSCGSSSGTDYALVMFNDPAQFHYAGIAGNGTWDMLHDRSMVHYASTPAPGEAGNVIVAFHREPNYEHIDQLDVGGTVTLKDRTCHSFTYRVTQRWVLDPGGVTQLVPTAGHELTLITCTPFWDDSQRIVWRAELVG